MVFFDCVVNDVEANILFVLLLFTFISSTQSICLNGIYQKNEEKATDSLLKREKHSKGF